VQQGCFESVSYIRTSSSRRRGAQLSARRQWVLLGLAREDDAAAMRRIDAMYTEHPFHWPLNRRA
jgi:hypothetical protein